MFTRIGPQGSCCLFLSLVLFQSAHAHEALPDLDKRASAPAIPVARREARSRAHEALQENVPQAQVEWDPRVGSPGWVMTRDGFLTGPDGAGRAVSAAFRGRHASDDPQRAVKAFVDQHSGLFGHDSTALGKARVKRDYVTEHSGMRTTVWQQQHAEVEVFDAVFQSHTTQRGELVNVSSRFLPEFAEATQKLGSQPPSPSIDATQAIITACANVGVPAQLHAGLTPQDEAVDAERRQFFRGGPVKGEARARLMWLPLDGATLKLVWEINFTPRGRQEMFLTLVDAETGEVELRRNLTDDISNASYRVFTGDSPTPFTPGYSAPGQLNQPATVSRTLVTWMALDTNASPAGWINDGVNETLGNNVSAHLDLDDDDLPDLPRPAGSPSRVFDFPMDLTQDPSMYRNAAVVSLFYWCNWIHDRLYQLGFTEAAGNFQQNNFGKGGLGNDRVQADAQDGGGMSNANFGTPADGMAPRMQMYLWSAPDPRRDGDFDAQIIIHEYVHGLANRLVGGGVLISKHQTKGQGEGWSDFYALALLSTAGENLAGTYTMGGYALANAGFAAPGDNYYFGIRRYPYSTDMSKNPLTFKDIDPTQFGPPPGVPTSPLWVGTSPSGTHNVGEIWCSMLWEARANLITKHGFATGNQLILQLVTDGMKLSPADPTFVQSRDAILQADQVLTGGANKNELWAAFAKRGLGVSAIAPANTTTTGAVEDFSIPDGLVVTPAIKVNVLGPYGGPFSWSSTSFVLSNATASSLTWRATTASPLQVSQSTGSLVAGGKVTNVVSLNLVAAAALPVGTHARQVTFSNQVTQVSQTRVFTIVVSQPLKLEPANSFANNELLYGPQGGPFESYYGPMRLTNQSNLSMQWKLNSTPEAAFTPAAGTLAGHASTNLIVGAGVGTHFLPVGTYTNTVVVSNLTSGGTLSRDVEIRVRNNRYLTQQFGFETSMDSDFFDLVGSRLTFVPNGSPEGYSVCREPAAAFPVDPAGGIEVLKTSYGYYSTEAITLSGGKKVSLFGESTNTVFVNFSGSITFGQGDKTYTPDHFAMRRVSALLGRTSEYATKDAGGVVSWKQLVDRLAVTWQNVVIVDTVKPNSVNSFQAELFFDGAIRLTYMKGTNQYATVGLSRGTNKPPDFFSTDFSELPSCGSALPQLTVTLPSSATEGIPLHAGAGKVSVSVPPVNALTVSLASSDTTEITVPASVLIPAGATSAVFNVTVVNDVILDGTRYANVTASAPFHLSGSASIAVHDNEITTLQLSLPASVTEGGSFALGTVTTAAPVGDNVVVTLSTPTTPPEVTVGFFPFTVIESGQSAATFPIYPVDDTRIDGTKPAAIVASVANWVSATNTLNVLDNETTQLTVVAPLFLSEGAGYLTNGGDVRISGTLQTNLTVNLATVGGGFFEYVVSPTATIPAGQTNAPFDIVILDDSQVESLESFQITANAPGFITGQTTVFVFDNDGPPAPFNPQPPHLASGVSIHADLAWGRTEGELLVNGGFESGALAGWTRVDSGGGGWVSGHSNYDPPGPDTPQTPLAGSSFALSMQYGNGRHEIYQDVFIPDGLSGVSLSWSQRLRNHGGAWDTNQQFRVELRNTANQVLTNIFVSQSGDPLLTTWSNRTFNLMPWRGQTIRVAFVEIDELGALNVSLDDVSVFGTPSLPTTWLVFFGTTPTPGQAQFQGTTTNTSWDLPQLAANTNYYWQVKSVRAGFTNNGPVWQFSTAFSLNQPPSIGFRNPGAFSTFTYPASIVLEPNSVIDDGIVSKVEFWADGAKLAEDPTSPYSFTWTNAALGEHFVWGVAQDSLGARGTSAVMRISVVPATGMLQTLVPFGSEWAYLDTGVNLGTAWRSNSYRPSGGWKFGPAKLGYGDGDEKTVVSFGDDPTAKHITTYFRGYFTPSVDLQLLQLRVLRDDGVAVFLNGREVMRNNLSAGANYLTLASTDITAALEPVLVVTNFHGSNAVVRSANLLAAEVHQVSATSVDLGFDLELTGVANLPPNVSLTAPENNAVFVTPANVNLAATAFDPYGIVTNVQFLANGASLGHDPTSPFALTWNNAPAGTHVVRAVATDHGGLTNISTTVTIHVIGPPPALGVSIEANNLVFRWSAASAGYRLESAPSLEVPINWEPVSGVPVPEGGLLRLAIPLGSNQQRYFRLVAP